MSKFSEKLSRGEIPSDQEWAEHLIEAHRNAPSMTPNAFAGLTSKEGLNSYQFLAKALIPRANEIDLVMDLACGDGFLVQYILPHVSARGQVIGIDMSESELSVARQKIKNQNVSFVCAEAKSLPVADRSVDYILCHLSFMLMIPLEPVVNELKRTLKPRGQFVAVVGDSRAAHGLLKEVQGIIFSVLTRNFPKIKETRPGDPRVFSLEGLKELFPPDFWKVPEVSTFEVFGQLSAEGMWEFMKDTYFVGILPEHEKLKLRAELMSHVQSKLDQNKDTSFSFPMRLISVARFD